MINILRILLFSSFLLVSCSGGKKKDLSKSDESLFEELSQSKGEGIEEHSTKEDVEIVENQSFEEPHSDEENLKEAIVSHQEEISNPAIYSGEIKEFTVLEDKTYALALSFSFYGDYRHWKVLEKLNPQLSIHNLKKGDVVKFYAPIKKFSWNPEGDPYLIQPEDTLGIISFKSYKTHKRWREIYENNQPFIRDPNLIFAGTTIYIVPEERNLASE